MIPPGDVYYPLLSILLEAYIDVPPMYFPVPGHPLGNENILLSCPPPVLSNTGGGGDMILKIFYYHVPPMYCAIQGEDMIVRYFHYQVGGLVWENT